jgi:D-alanyl-D-alanine carboxypeptidase/D-alanyl-D-alanine-endopeptidase (penicillin-binding protein 4)
VIKPWDSNEAFLLLNGKNFSASVPFRPDIFTIEWLLADTIKKKIGPALEKYERKKFTALYSRPSDSLFKPMMHNSDNFFAEQTLLMVSNERLGYMSAEDMIDSLLKNDLKDVPQKPRWVDGSGLSRYNLFTPKSFVYILNKMQVEFGMDRLKIILPTGAEGSLKNYFTRDSSFIYAKTGTLSNNAALSGYLITKKGKLLIFSILVNNYQTGATPVRRATEQFLNGIREKY